MNNEIVPSNGESGGFERSLEVAKNKLEPISNKFALIVDDLAGRANPGDELYGASPAAIAKRPIQLGLWVIIIFFILFGLWATFAKLSSAAVAIGTVVVDSNSKSIQHLEGGIVEEILVKEGDKVELNQPLLKMRNTNAKAKYDLIQGQYRAALALQARLVAERDMAKELTFPEYLTKDSEDPKVAEIMNTQKNLFDARRATLEGQIGVVKQKSAQLLDEIKGYEAQKTATDTQLRLINEEVAVVQKLLESGNANRPRLLTLQRRAAELQGMKGQYSSGIASAKQKITEAELEAMNLRNNFESNVVKELRDVQVQISDLEENLRTSTDVFERTVITAPQAGIVKGLKYHTVGGVIAPGDVIMQIVPDNDVLKIEAQIQPQDIDVVHEGLIARVRLTPFKTRKIPPVDGVVKKVSPDVFTDQRTGRTYYTAQIEVDQNFLKELKEVKLYPGMPSEVLIITGERSMLSYLTSPLQDSMYQAFREQ